MFAVPLLRHLARPIAVAALAAAAIISTAVAQEPPHWDYFSLGGPEHWGDEYPACNLPGESPVDLAGATPRDGLSLDYQPTPLVIVNNGHTLQVNVEPGSWMTVDGQRYQLLQFHFHTPSEHTFGGVHAAMEIHFVHRSQAGELAVLGVLLTEGHEGPGNRAFVDIMEIAPKEAGTASSLRPIQGDDLLPGPLAYYGYDGSLTTPPCSGGVKWLVLAETLPLAPSMIREFRGWPFLNQDGQFVGNARPVQPLDGRLGDTAAPSRIRAPATGDAGLAGN
jgi:carbonic anhydrase